MAVDLSHAEQGKTVKIEFLTVSSGVPYNPTTITAEIFDSSNTSVTLLTPVSTGQAGHYYVLWDIPTNQPTGVYRLHVDADSGTFIDDIYFEVFASGTFTQASSSVKEELITKLNQLSKARNEEVFIQLIRLILRDYEKLNRLTTGKETSDGEIRAAMMMAISQYNSTPPPLAPVTFENFPSIARLAIGTIAWVLQSSTFLRARNTLQYSDGGVSVDPENFAIYQALAQQAGQSFEAWTIQYKKSVNVAATFGISPTGVHSEYYLLSYFLGDAFVSGEVVLS